MLRRIAVGPKLGPRRYWSDSRGAEPYALNTEEPPYDSKFIVGALWLPGGADYDPHEGPAHLRQGDESQNYQPIDTEKPTNPV